MYITSSGGTWSSERWTSITTDADGTGTQVWGQGDGTLGSEAGDLTDQPFSGECGQTYYINAYDTYGDGWNDGMYEIWTGAGKTGTLVANNGGVSPDDGADGAGLETSEAFTFVCEVRHFPYVFF